MIPIGDWRCPTSFSNILCYAETCCSAMRLTFTSTAKLTSKTVGTTHRAIHIGRSLAENTSAQKSWYGVASGKSTFWVLSFSSSNLTGEAYLQMSQDDLLPQINSLRDGYPLWFMQDGAPPHYARVVREWLDLNFDNWIGRRGTVEWGPRSPDLSP